MALHSLSPWIIKSEKTGTNLALYCDIYEREMRMGNVLCLTDLLHRKNVVNLGWIFYSWEN